MENLNAALTEIASGQIYNGTRALFDTALGLIIGPAFPLLGLLQLPVTMAQKFANVVATIPNAVIGLGLGALGNIAGVVAAAGMVGQNVVDALSTGDLIGALNAIVGAPAALVGAVLNGFPDTGAPGLLSPGGPVDQLMNAAKAIAVALGAVAPAPAVAPDTLAKVSSVPDSVALSASTDTVDTVTVSTTVTEEAVTEEPVTEEPVVEEPVAEEPVVEEPVVEEPSATTETETETTETGSGSTGKPPPATVGPISATGTRQNPVQKASRERLAAAPVAMKPMRTPRRPAARTRTAPQAVTPRPARATATRPATASSSHQDLWAPSNGGRGPSALGACRAGRPQPCASRRSCRGGV